MRIYILLVLVAYDLINAGGFPFFKTSRTDTAAFKRTTLGIEDLPPALLANIMQHLPLKEQKSLLMLSGSAIAFDDALPRTFATRFGINAIDRIFERRLQENEEFSRTVINEMSAEFFPALINLYAQQREWRKVKFMLSNGVDPLLLRYSIKRASRDAFHADLVRLRKLVGNHVDVDAIINTQLDVDELNELLAPHAQRLADSEWNIMVPLPQNPDTDTIDRLLSLASYFGNVGVVKILLDHGADVHTMDDLALKMASNYGHVEAVKILLAHGANVHAQDDYALRWASQDGHVAAVKELLAHGADIHAQDDYSLFLASNFRHVEVVKVLLAHGASQRPYMAQLARYAGHYEIADLLQAKLDQSPGMLSRIAQFLKARFFAGNFGF